MAGATWNCCRLGASSVYTIQPCTSLKCHFIRSHLRRMHVSVTCNPHFCQNDLDLLRATAVTRGRNGYRNKSQNKRMYLGKKTVPSLLPELEEPETFRRRIRRSATELSPLPRRHIQMQSLRQSQPVPRFPRVHACLLYTSPSPRDQLSSRMPSSA